MPVGINPPQQFASGARTGPPRSCPAAMQGFEMTVLILSAPDHGTFAYFLLRRLRGGRSDVHGAKRDGRSSGAELRLSRGGAEFRHRGRDLDGAWPTRTGGARRPGAPDSLIVARERPPHICACGMRDHHRRVGVPSRRELSSRMIVVVRRRSPRFSGSLRGHSAPRRVPAVVGWLDGDRPGTSGILLIFSIFRPREIYYPAIHHFVPLLIGIALLRNR